MACLWSSDPPNFEDLLPPEDGAEPQESPDEITMRKLDAVMLQYGGVVSGRIANAPVEPDAWTQKMWRLMGVEGGS